MIKGALKSGAETTVGIIGASLLAHTPLHCSVSCTALVDEHQQHLHGHVTQFDRHGNSCHGNVLRNAQDFYFIYSFYSFFLDKKQLHYHIRYHLIVACSLCLFSGLHYTEDIYISAVSPVFLSTGRHDECRRKVPATCSRTF